MTVLQSVCSHGHKLQFGDVQQAFDTGDPIKREQPLFVRMPPDGVPGVSREVWVQLLKTVNGLADGTREWRNCFLATARDWVVRRPSRNRVFRCSGAHKEDTMVS